MIYLFLYVCVVVGERNIFNFAVSFISNYLQQDSAKGLVRNVRICESDEAV